MLLRLAIHRHAFREKYCERVVFTPRRMFLTSNLIDELKARHLLNQVTKPDTLARLLEQSQTVYSGIDPTAESLHIGHLLPLMCLLHFQLRGHKIISLIGGATALIGDPSGRSQARKPSDSTAVQLNAQTLTQSVSNFFSRAVRHAEIRYPESGKNVLPVCVMDNLEWYNGMKLLEFLRLAGKSARVNAMLSRDSVKSRLESRQGISFAEFSYQLLQAYDFYTLHGKENCTLQIGGSDQWGNIIAGIEMINHIANEETDQVDVSQTKAYGLTTPLIVDSKGEKLGKSAGNAVWLNPRMTSPFDFFQHFLKTSDEDVERYLRMFTLLPLTQVDRVMLQHREDPERRTAQHLLAQELTEMIHGAQATRHACLATSCLFGGNYSNVAAEDIIGALYSDQRLIFCEEDEILGKSIVRLAAAHGLVSSNSAARTLLKQGGLYVNNVRVQDPLMQLSHSELIDDQMAIVRAGRDKIIVLCLRK